MRRFFFGLFFLFSFIGMAYAEKADRNQPTEIEADQMVADDVKQITIFTGNVIATQGTRIAKAAKIVMVQDPEGYQYTTLYATPGQLASVREKRDGGNNLWAEAYAERIEYNNKNEVMKLYIRANLKQLEGATVTENIKGEFISYDSKSEFYQVHNTVQGKSSPGRGRVKAVLEPKRAP